MFKKVLVGLLAIMCMYSFNSYGQLFDKLKKLKDQAKEAKDKINDTKKQVKDAKDKVNEARNDVNQVKGEIDNVKDQVNQGGDNGNDVSNSNDNDGDDPIEVRHLKSDLNSVKTHLAANELDFAEGSLKLAKQSLEELKKAHPEMDVSQYESQIAKYEQAINAKDDAINSKDDAKQLIRKIAYTLMDLIDTDVSGNYVTKERPEQYYKDCVEADYLANKKKVDELVQKFPEMKNENDINDRIDQIYNIFPKKFAEYTDFLFNQSNIEIEKSYASKKSNNLLSAKESAELALLYANSILAVTPDNKLGLRAKSDADKILQSVDNTMSSVTYTSDYHKQMAGQLVVSKSPIVLKQENSSTNATSLTLKDNMYGMAYLKGTISQLTDGGSPSSVQLVFSVLIDGNAQNLDEFPFKMTKEMETTTALPFEILPAIEKAKDCFVSERIANLFAKSSPREHQITFVLKGIYMSREIVLASGTYTIDFSQGQEELDKLAVQYHKQAIKNVFLSRPEMRNPSLEKDFMEIARSAFPDEGNTPLKAVITENSWTIYRHEISGIILYRRINGEVAVKLPNGGCRVHGITISQNFNGSTYGKSQLSAYDSVNGSDIDCGNVNK